MKILYVNPGKIAAGMDAIIKGPPLSLASIAAMVPEHGATLVDFKVDKVDPTRFRKMLNGYDVVAITSLTAQISSALEVAALAKEAGCTTVLGGYQATLATESVIEHPAVDYAVRGEGENTFKALVDHLAGKSPHSNRNEILGISYKNENGQVIHAPDRGLERNLDNFPLPRRDLLRGKKYHYFGATVDTLESSRGCPFSCNFCCITKMWSDPVLHVKYRTKSLKRIMEELYATDRSRFFTVFCEDNFTISVPRTMKILETMVRAGLSSRMHFSAQSRVDTLVQHPEICDRLADANFRQIFLGIESVHQQSLDGIGKRTTPEMIRQAVDMLHDRGISIFGGVIIGFPGETKEMVRQTVDFAIELDLDCVQFTPITAFPGTKFYDEMKAAGQVTSFNFRNYDLFHPMMCTPQLANTDIYRLVLEAYSRFYMSKKWIFGKIRQYALTKRFAWFRPLLPKFAREFVVSGWKMFRTQGIHSGLGKLADEERKTVAVHSPLPVPREENAPAPQAPLIL